MGAANESKAELRRRMRRVRRDVASVARSTAVVERLVRLGVAGVVMGFEAIPGEPDVTAVADEVERSGGRFVLPAPVRDAASPVPPEELDVVIVPGVAFTVVGDRLGQGGGWYDRVLAKVRSDCRLVGVCFDEQVVDVVPVERHDVRVGWVVTPTRTLACATGDEM